MAECEPLTGPTPLKCPGAFPAELLSGDVLAGDLLSAGLLSGDLLSAGPLSPDPASFDAHALGFSVTISTEDEQRVVHLAGELDLSVRGLVYGACLDGDANVVVEMGRLTFMDCAGYGSLIEAGLVLEGHGHSMVLRNQGGQPAQIMQMFLSDAPPA